MAVVAVAGGTGGVGKTIVDRLAREPNLQVIVLSRGVSEYLQIGVTRTSANFVQTTSHEEDVQHVQHVQIDYKDIPSMINELEHHKVQTIISTIGLISDETSQSQLNLIEAAEQAQSTQRFIPSEFSFIQTEEYVPNQPRIPSPV